MGESNIAVIKIKAVLWRGKGMSAMNRLKQAEAAAVPPEAAVNNFISLHIDLGGLMNSQLENTSTGTIFIGSQPMI